MTGSATSDRPTATWRRAALRVARSLVLLYAAWCATLYFMQPSMLYLPLLAGTGLQPAEIEERVEQGTIERHWIERDGARVEAWLMRSLREEPARGLVSISHGNAELIDHLGDDARRWRRLGFDVVLPEYRGYGRSTGSPSEEAIVADTLDAIDWALGRTGHTALVLHGRSLGTGVVAQVAARLGEIPSRPTLELVALEAPFTSIASYAPRYGVPPFLVRDPYRTDEVLPTLTCPVIILHTRGDDVVPIEHGRMLASLAPSRISLVEFEGSHNSGISTTNGYWNAIARALERLDD